MARCVAKGKAARETRTPLDLARALLRYGRMTDPARAYDRMHAEWPPDVARILDQVLWTEVKIANRSVEDVATELHTLNRKAEAQAEAVRRLMATRAMTLEQAVAKAMGMRGMARSR